MAVSRRIQELAFRAYAVGMLLKPAAGGWFLWQAWRPAHPWRATPCLALLPLGTGLGMFALTLLELLR